MSALNIECPFCGAGVGENCHTTAVRRGTGKELEFPHTKRRDAWSKSDGAKQARQGELKRLNEGRVDRQIKIDTLVGGFNLAIALLGLRTFLVKLALIIVDQDLYDAFMNAPTPFDSVAILE